MDRRFIIIHPSDVIRRGIYSVLRETFHSEFILLSEIKGINDYSGISNLRIVVLAWADILNPEAKDYISRVLTSCNEISFLTITDQQPDHKGSISIGQSAYEIQQTVKNQLDHNRSSQGQISELSDREKDVLSLVALGHSNKEIAEKLFISIHTVITHRKNITEKLGIKSISGLTVYAILNKLIDTENIDPSSLI